MRNSFKNDYILPGMGMARRLVWHVGHKASGKRLIGKQGPQLFGALMIFGGRIERKVDPAAVAPEHVESSPPISIMTLFVVVLLRRHIQTLKAAVEFLEIEALQPVVQRLNSKCAHW